MTTDSDFFKIINLNRYIETFVSMLKGRSICITFLQKLFL